MAPSNTRLPAEILLHIILLPDSPLADLAVFSRVCRSWYRILFSPLHDTVSLSWDAPTFAARILNEHVPLRALPATSYAPGVPLSSGAIGGLHVADHVHHLILDNRAQRQEHTFHPLESAIITAALPKLTKLKSIEWTLPWFPENTEMFRAFVQYCRNIEHISFDIPMTMNRYDNDQFADMFGFTNLKHIRVKDFRLAHDPDTNGHVPSSLTQMIMSSPNLEYLELDLQENPLNEEYGNIGWLVEAIDPVLEHTFPNLKSFLLKGTANIDSEYLVRADEPSAIRHFLSQHPNLHTLELPWDWAMNALIHEPLQDATQALRGALPNLRHLTGPTYFVMLFLQLGFAQNLECIGIHDTADDEESDLSIFTRSFPRLPNLRRLEFLASYMLDCMSFSEIVRATPNITELTIRWIDGDPQLTRAALTRLTNLKRLNFGFNVLPHLANRRHKYISKAQESQDVFELARQCTSLETLRIYPEEDIPDTFDYQISWHIRRYSTGVINTTFSCLRKRPVIGGGLMLDARYHQWLFNKFTEQYWGFTPAIEAV